MVARTINPWLHPHGYQRIRGIWRTSYVLPSIIFKLLKLRLLTAKLPLLLASRATWKPQLKDKFSCNCRVWCKGWLLTSLKFNLK